MLNLLKRPDLIQTKAFINGMWIDTPQRFDVFNPYDQSVLAQVVNGNKKLTEEAIDTANIAFQSWKKIFQPILNILYWVEFH